MSWTEGCKILCMLYLAVLALLVTAFYADMMIAVAEAQVQGLTVWIPPKMLAGQVYSGVIIVAEPVDYERHVRLVSSSPALVVPERVTIQRGMHQAGFDIETWPQLASDIRTASVSVVMEGLFDQASTTLYDRQSSSMIRLLAFNSTNLPFARVVAVSGQPLDYDDRQLFFEDTEVTLAYPGGTAKAVIDGRKGYGVVDVPLLDGPNNISVFGRPAEAITVTRTSVDLDVKVSVSALEMIPAWSDEWGFQRSWVLVDASSLGKPIRGDFVAVATSSNPDMVQVERETMVCSLPCAIPVRGHGQGQAQIGVQLTGIGGGAVDIQTVLPVHHMVSAAHIESIASKHIRKTVGASDFAVNSVSLLSHRSEKAISSEVTDGPVYGLVGHYATISADYTLVEDRDVITRTHGQISATVPLVIPGVKYYMSIAGPAQAEWSFFSGLVKGDVGRGSTVGGLGRLSVSSAPVGIGSSHSSMSSFEVRLSEPVGQADMEGALAAVTLQGIRIQLAGYLVDGQVRAYPSQNDAVYAIDPASVSLADIVQTQTGSQLEVDVPPIVYSAEGLVFAAHVTHAGIPVDRAYPLYEFGGVDAQRAGQVQETDIIFIHSSSRHVTRVTVAAVTNSIDLHVSWPDVLKLDRPYEMVVTTGVSDVQVHISGDVRGTYSSDSSKVTLYPAGAEQDKRVAITASKAGWATATVEKVLPAKRYVSITVDAVDARGEPVYAPFMFEYETVDGETGRIQNMTPYMFDVRPLASKPVLTFGTTYTDSNYDTSYLHKSTRETDIGFTGIFERQTKLTVKNGAGSGYYLPNQSVRVEADPDNQVLGFAVVNRFSHWEYDREDIYMQDRSRVQDIIVGNTDATITAVYVTDFGALAALVLSTAVAVGAYAYREEIRTILEAYRRRT